MELVVFFAMLAVIRLLRRTTDGSRSVRIDVYHHWPEGGSGERWPKEDDDQPRRTINDNVVPLRKK